MPNNKKLAPKKEEANERNESLNLAIARKEEALYLNLYSLYRDWPALHRELGVYYCDVNKFDKARYHLQRANCLNKESPSALTALAAVFDKIGEANTADLLMAKADQVARKHRKKAAMARRARKSKKSAG